MEDFCARLSSPMASSPTSADGSIEPSVTGNRAPFKRKYEVDGLFKAALTGDLAAFQNLVRPFDFGVGKDGKSVLHYAAAGGSKEVCKFLLEEAKLDIDLKDMEAGEAPLHLAISEGHFETAAFLLENGADTNVINKTTYRTPLHYAVEHGPLKLIKLLLSKGAKIINQLADCGTPLHLAAAEGQQDFLDVLLKNNADPNMFSFDGFSPLMTSIRAQSIECVELLIKAGADPNFRGSKGRTPLGLAALEGSREILEYLLNVGADPNVTNDYGMTPVEEAALRGKRWAVKVLFPLTAPSPTVPEWTIDGLFKSANTLEAVDTRMQKVKELHFRTKSAAVEYFKRGDYLRAAVGYTKAMEYLPIEVDDLSQRSLCWAMMNQGKIALMDAEACVTLSPDWAEAYLRKGSALMILKEFENAVDAFRRGCDLDPENKELQRSLREAVEAEQRGDWPGSPDFSPSSKDIFGFPSTEDCAPLEVKHKPDGLVESDSSGDSAPLEVKHKPDGLVESDSSGDCAPLERKHKTDGLVDSASTRHQARFKRKYKVDGLFEAALNGDLTAFQNLAKSFQSKKGFMRVDFGISKDGKGALHYAAAGGSKEICKFLLEEVKLDINMKDFEAEEAPLHLAILEGHFETAGFLLEHGADPNVRNKMGWTSMHYAAEHGPVTLIQLLLSKGAEINATADCGTALQHAAGEGREDAVKVLLDNNADPNLSLGNSSPLVKSIRAQSIECVKLLLMAGADINSRGRRGSTPLADAATEGSAKILKYLLDVGADPNVTNDNGLTPAEEAVRKGRRWAVKILFPMMAPIPAVHEWSIAGLDEHVSSWEALHQEKQRRKERHVLAKLAGAECFKRADYHNALALYTEAMAFHPLEAEDLSRRSLCWAKTNQGKNALMDAEDCIKLRPDWPEAYLRKGSALVLLKEFERAVDAFCFGYDLDPSNEELGRSLREAVEALLKNTVIRLPYTIES